MGSSLWSSKDFSSSHGHAGLHMSVSATDATSHSGICKLQLKASPETHQRRSNWMLHQLNTLWCLPSIRACYNGILHTDLCPIDKSQNLRVSHVRDVHARLLHASGEEVPFDSGKSNRVRSYRFCLASRMQKRRILPIGLPLVCC
jgi:hypothetical protein